MMGIGRVKVEVGTQGSMMEVDMAVDMDTLCEIEVPDEYWMILHVGVFGCMGGVPLDDGKHFKVRHCSVGICMLGWCDLPRA